MNTKPIKKIRHKSKIDKSRLEIKADYYCDHYGYVEIRHKGLQIFCKEDQVASRQLKSLEELISSNEAKLKAFKAAYKILNSEIKKLPKAVKE